MLTLHDQRFPEAGGIDAQSVTNFLGKHSLSPTEVLIREAVQNSWDARLGSHISFRVEERDLSPEQTRIVLCDVLGERPRRGRVLDLDRHAASGRLRVLTVADDGTRGLGGPLRADVAIHDERGDFVDFVRNIGRSKTKGLDGGTYGLGKGVFFQASQVGVCLIYTQARYQGVIQSRFIAMSMGDPDYEVDGKRFTGRNWWGLPTGSRELVDPVVGRSAWEIADSLGMPVPSSERTGTTIMILAPGLGAESRAADLRGVLRDALLKWTWPKLQPDDDPAIKVTIRGLDGREEIVLASLDEDLNAYRAAYRLAEADNSAVQAMERWWPLKSGTQNLGILAIRLLPTVEGDSGDEDMSNHVALLRDPRQVVKYLPVPRLPDGTRIQGVFLADPSQNDLFAKSEPATHDDWVPTKTQGAKGSRNYVRITLDQIARCIKELGLELRPPEAAAPSTPGATRLSGMLGDFVTGFSGSGAEKQRLSPSKGTKGGASAERSRVSYPSEPELAIAGSQLVCLVPFEISAAKAARGQALAEVVASVITDGGGAEGEPPSGAELPLMLGWDVDGQRVSNASLPFDAAHGLRAVAVVSQPQGTQIKVEVRVKEAPDAG